MEYSEIIYLCCMTFSGKPLSLKQRLDSYLNILKKLDIKVFLFSNSLSNN